MKSNYIKSNFRVIVIIFVALLLGSCLRQADAGCFWRRSRCAVYRPCKPVVTYRPCPKPTPSVNPDPVSPSPSDTSPPSPLPSPDTDEPAGEPAHRFGKKVMLPVFQNGLGFSGKVGCGPYAVASLFAALGQTIDQAEFDRITSELDPHHDGTTPKQVIDYLGPSFELRQRSSAGLDELARQIDRGCPVLVAVQLDEPHWALVTGYTTDEHGQFVTWTVHDAGPTRGEVTTERFLDIWSEYNNHCVLLRPRDTVPPATVVTGPVPAEPPFETAGAMRFLSAVTNSLSEQISDIRADLPVHHRFAYGACVLSAAATLLSGLVAVCRS